MILRTLILCFTILFTGCASFPKTPSEFKASAAGAHTFTVDSPLQSAYELVATQTARCHQANLSTQFLGRASFILPTGTVTVQGQNSGNSASIQVKYSDPLTGGLLQLIELSPVDATKTTISVYKINNSTRWSTAAENVETWFKGGTSCYQMK